MKRILLSFCILTLALFPSLAQNKKAVRDSIAQVKFERAVAAIEAKDFVIIVDSYKRDDGSIEINTDFANFLSFEKEFVFVQGQIIAGNSYTNKLEVSDYNKVADKKGNIKINMRVKGNFINAKVEIFMKQKTNYADVIITPTSGTSKYFSGEVVPTSQSKYFKRAGVI